MQDPALRAAGSALPLPLPLPHSSSLAPGAAGGCQLPAPHPHRYRPICAVQRANCLGPEEEKKRVTLPGTGTDSAKIIWTDPRMCSEAGPGEEAARGWVPDAGSRSAGPGGKSPCSAPSVPQFPPALGWRGAVPGGGVEGRGAPAVQTRARRLPPPGMEAPPRRPCPLLPLPQADPGCAAVPSLQEKRKRQTEIENKRRQLEDDRRQLQHLKVRTPPGDPSSAPGMGRSPQPRGRQDRDPPLPVLPSPRLCGRGGCWRGPRPPPPRRMRR